MVGIASTGPILAIMLLNIIIGQNNIQGQAEAFIPNIGILSPYIRQFPILMKESLLTLLPLFILFIIFNKSKFKLNQKKKNRIYKGLLYTYIGLTLFLVGVNAGFMEVGRVMGNGIANLESNWLLPAIGVFIRYGSSPS